MFLLIGKNVLLTQFQWLFNVTRDQNHQGLIKIINYSGSVFFEWSWRICMFKKFLCDADTVIWEWYFRKTVLLQLKLSIYLHITLSSSLSFPLWLHFCCSICLGKSLGFCCTHSTTGIRIYWNLPCFRHGRIRCNLE